MCVTWLIEIGDLAKGLLQYKNWTPVNLPKAVSSSVEPLLLLNRLDVGVAYWFSDS